MIIYKLLRKEILEIYIRYPKLEIDDYILQILLTSNNINESIYVFRCNWLISDFRYCNHVNYNCSNLHGLVADIEQLIYMEQNNELPF